ncbi:hypothetical protein D3C87_1177300 [compost metagenome]
MLLADLHLQVGGAHVVREVRQHWRQILFGSPVRRVILEHQGERFALSACGFEVHQPVPGRVIRLTIHATPLHPNDVHVPALGNLIDEKQCLFTLLAGVLEEQMDVRRQSAAVGFENLVDHVSAGASTTNADLGRTCDEVGIHNCSRQPITSPAGVIR